MARYSKPGSSSPKTSIPSADHDAFVEKTLSFTQWVRKRRTRVTWGGLALGLAAVALVYYSGVQEDVRTQAAMQLEILQIRTEAGDTEGLDQDLAFFLSQFGDTPFATEARIALAETLVKGGRLEDAEQALAPTVSELGTPLGAQAVALYAAILEDVGDQDAAERIYIRLGRDAQLSFQRRDALADAARIRMARGDLSGAAELYDELLDEIGEDDLARGQVEMRRAEALAQRD